MNWKTRITYVDIETGEILGQIYRDEYIIVKKETITKINQTTQNGTKYITTYVRRNGQQSIFETNG